jgi:hypothetical protein
LGNGKVFRYLRRQELVESLCEDVVSGVIRSQRVRFVAVMAGKREEVSNDVVVSFEMLGGKTMTAVKEDGGKVAGDRLDGWIAHGYWLDAAELVEPTEGRRIVS